MSYFTCQFYCQAITEGIELNRPRSIYQYGSEAFGSKLQIFEFFFVSQFPKETCIQRKQRQIETFVLKTSLPC